MYSFHNRDYIENLLENARNKNFTPQTNSKGETWEVGLSLRYRRSF